MKHCPIFIKMITAAKIQPQIGRCLNLLPLFLLLLTNRLSAQTEPLPGNEIYEIFNPEKQPSFPGGEQEMLRFITRNFQVPHKVDLDSLVGSRMVLSFVVDTLGHLNDIKILKDMGEGFGQEAVRVVKSMPPWIPGELNGRKVNVKFLLPIRPRLE